MNIDVLSVLRNFVQKNGSQEKAASLLGITQTHVSNMLSGRRKVLPSIGNKLGLKLVTHWEKIK